jgi:hypothetical protein
MMRDIILSPWESSPATHFLVMSNSTVESYLGGNWANPFCPFGSIDIDIDVGWGKLLLRRGMACSYYTVRTVVLCREDGTIRRHL